MSKYIKVSIAFLLVLSLMLTFVAISLKNTSSGEASIVDAKKNKILACLGENKTGYIQLPSVKNCIDSALSGDKNVNDAKYSNKAFREAQKINPLTYTFCHKNMHDLAHKIPSDEVLKVLLMDNWNTCEWGFLHGLLEDAAVGNKSEFFEPIIKICNSWNDMRDRSECAHSVGHGVWNSTHKIEESLSVCSEFKLYYDARMCAMGSFMQIYWATSGTPSQKFDLKPLLILENCVDTKGEIRNLCIDSVVFSYSLFYRKKTTKIRDFVSLSMNMQKRLPEAILNKITYYAEIEKKVCNVFSDTDKRRCYFTLWNTISDFDGPFYTRSDVLEALCKPYPDKYKECMIVGIGVKNYWASKKVYSY